MDKLLKTSFILSIFSLSAAGVMLIAISYFSLDDVNTLIDSFNLNKNFIAFPSKLVLNLRFKGTLLCVASGFIFFVKRLVEIKNSQITLYKKSFTIPFIAIFISFLTYLFTLVPEVDWGDAAELSLHAYQLGVTHPTGYPVHTVLGKLFSLAFSEPALATNLMSAVFTSLTVGLISYQIMQMTENSFAGLFAPLLFSFSPVIWGSAITTEVYSVNIFIFALSLYLILSWHRNPSPKLLLYSAIIFGFSLGSYLANLILIPAFILIIFLSNTKKFSSSFVFLTVVGITGCIVLSWSYFRSDIRPIFSLYLPKSFTETILFLTGAEFKAGDISNFDFSLKRIFDVSYSFGRFFFLYLGAIPALAGFFYQCRKKPTEFIAFLTIVIINTGYFTGYSLGGPMGGNSIIYFIPSFFIFSFWIAYGIHFFHTLNFGPHAKPISRIAIICLLAALLFTNTPLLLKRSLHFPVTEFASSSFKNLPDNAVVVLRWSMTPVLLYFQKVHGLRRDLTVVEYDRTRHYDSGTITADSKYIDKIISSRPVYVDKIWPNLKDKYKFQSLNKYLYKVEPLDTISIN